MQKRLRVIGGNRAGRYRLEMGSAVADRKERRVVNESNTLKPRSACPAVDGRKTKTETRSSKNGIILFYGNAAQKELVSADSVFCGLSGRVNGKLRELCVPGRKGPRQRADNISQATSLGKMGQPSEAPKCDVS